MALKLIAGNNFIMKTMINFYKKKWMIVALLFKFTFSFSQTNQIKIRFIANCGLSISDSVSNIYTDFPYKSGFLMYSKYNKSEFKNLKTGSVYLFTHRHPDHYSFIRVMQLSGKKYGPWNLKKMEKLSNSIQDFSIQAFKTKHRISRRHCSYLITWHGKKIFISGDTESADTIATIKNIDWAFVPVWLLMDAKEKGLKVDAKRIGLYHIGIHDKIKTQNTQILLMDKLGEIITIPY